MFWCEDRDGQRVAEWLEFRVDSCNTCTCVEGRREVEVLMTFHGTQYLEKAFKSIFSTCRHRHVVWLAKHYGPKSITNSKIYILPCLD